jgi:Arc/MetJ-type ribon-helix-helix transcriptional regulator
MKTISLKLPDHLSLWIEERAAKLGRTKSDLVRETLERERRETASRQRKKTSCHDLMQDVCGSFEGPHDLSTNPKYMEGYGQSPPGRYTAKCPSASRP